MSEKKTETNAHETVKEDDGKVELYIPRTSQRGEQQVMIGINGKNWIIPKGQRVRVPPFVKEEYERSVAAADVMYQRREELIHEESDRGE